MFHYSNFVYEQISKKKGHKYFKYYLFSSESYLYNYFGNVNF